MSTGHVPLANKTALVALGPDGTGAADALHIARCGADVAITGADAQRGQRLADVVRALGRRALYIHSDARETAPLGAALRQAADHFGRIHILVDHTGRAPQHAPGWNAPTQTEP